MAKITLITGGAASGKSSFAVAEARNLRPKKVLFIATARPIDAEMKKKIANHKRERPEGWETIEGKNDELPALISCSVADVLVLDCLTLFVADYTKNPQTARGKAEQVLAALLANKKVRRAFIVTNEVGWGVVPVSKSGRAFRELLGGVNKTFAAAADTFVLMVAGVPFRK